MTLFDLERVAQNLRSAGYGNYDVGFSLSPDVAAKEIVTVPVSAGETAPKLDIINES